MLTTRSLTVAAVLVAGWLATPEPPPAATGRGACFLLHEVGVGEVQRDPSTTCSIRVTPQSTFKIPHALAALDSGVVKDVNAIVKYDGRPADQPLWRRDHSLATAMKYSVVWFFQDIASRLGEAREREYVTRFDYGNRDVSGGLTTFWLGRSLAISPEEQLRFLIKLYGNQLNVKAAASEAVRRILVQPDGAVVNATGEHVFAKPWPPGTVLSAKTGAGPTGDGNAVRWLVGHVQRGSRSWIFVSNVVGDSNLPAMAAVEQAEQALIAAHVLR